VFEDTLKLSAAEMSPKDSSYLLIIISKFNCKSDFTMIKFL